MVETVKNRTHIDRNRGCGLFGIDVDLFQQFLIQISQTFIIWAEQFPQTIRIIVAVSETGEGN